VKDNVSNIAGNIINEKSIDNFLDQPLCIQLLYIFMIGLMCYSIYAVIDFTNRYNLYLMIMAMVYNVYKRENKLDLKWFGKTRF
jgi:hypothetical protein